MQKLTDNNNMGKRNFLITVITGMVSELKLHNIIYYDYQCPFLMRIVLQAKLWGKLVGRVNF